MKNSLVQSSYQNCRKFTVHFVFIISLLSLCLPLATAHGPAPEPTIEWVPGQLLIKLSEDISSESLSQAEGEGSLSATFEELSLRAKLKNARPLFPHLRKATSATPQQHSSNAGVQALTSFKSELSRWLLLEVDLQADIGDLTKQLALLPEVEIAEPDYLFRLERQQTSKPSSLIEKPTINALFSPNDPDFVLQWGLSDINAPDAWGVEMGSPSQVIAVIDTGVDIDHPELSSKIWINPDELPGDSNFDGCPGICGVDDDGDGLVDEDNVGRQRTIDGDWNANYAGDDDENGFIDDFNGWNWVDSNNFPQDDNGHGTHVSGIAAAATDNGVGIAGACPLCTIMPLKAFQSNGVGSFSDIAKAVEYAWRNGASVINMSFSSLGDSALVEDALSLAFSSASLIAAAGNSGKSRLNLPFYPAHYDFVLGVEAGTKVPSGDLAGFSNYGYELRNPGENILSPILDDDYTSWSGTSMSAPLVSGTVGLVQSLHSGDPDWGPDLVFGQLIQSGGNALEALSLSPSPDLNFIHFEIADNCPDCDRDGQADYGETIEIVAKIRNLWGGATAVVGTLSTADSLATVTNGLANWGDVAPTAYSDNSENPFTVEIDASASDNLEISFDLSIVATNGGTGVSTQIVLTVNRDVEIGGFITSDEIWTADRSYQVTKNLLVASGVTLTIEPGTNIHFSEGIGIVVEGELVARGTTNNKITIGPALSEFDLRNATPAVFDGKGNYLSGTILEHCVLENAGGSRHFGRAFISKSIIKSSGDPDYFQITEGRVDSNLFLNTGLNINDFFSIVGQNTITGNGKMGSVNRDFKRNSLIEGVWELEGSVGLSYDLTENYWGTVNQDEVSSRIVDFLDIPSLPIAAIEPTLTEPDSAAPITVSDIVLSPASPVGSETVTFTVNFSRPVSNTSADPLVSFGQSPPFTSHPIDKNGSWLDSKTWQAQADISLFTGDGPQQISVTGVEDFDGFPILHNDYRFGFEIVTSGTSAKGLNGQGRAGSNSLSWSARTKNSIANWETPLIATDDIAGYNIYRSLVSGGPYNKINSAIVTANEYVDFDVVPGQTYYYVFRVVTTDLLESTNSDEASATPLDTIPAIITHTPISSAPTGQPLTLFATITDNIEVIGADVFYRPLGSSGSYFQLNMINSVDDQYTVNLPSTEMVAPGIEYYMEATDGVTSTFSASENDPYEITVRDQPVVLNVSPALGSFSGGDAVTITGSNFVNPPKVRFGGIPSLSVTFNSSTELIATTAEHYPLLVDVDVENPNTTVGTLNNAFTFVGNTTTLSLPNHANGDRLSFVQLPISADLVDGLVAAKLVIQFDPTDLTAIGASVGALTNGFAMSTNTSIPGEITISLASPSPVTGSGNIVVLELEILAAPNVEIPLSFASADLNDGAIPNILDDGLLTVNNSFSLEGSVSYFRFGEPVPNTQLDLTGTGSYSVNTDAAGIFSFSGVPTGTYNLEPSKSDGWNESIISPYDASLALQHSAGINVLSGNSALAADVNNINGITPVDASLILQYSAGIIDIPFAGSSKAWMFEPTIRNYASLDQNLISQDFTAILLGDISGNWANSPAQVKMVSDPTTISFDYVDANHGETIDVPLRIENSHGLLGALIIVNYDSLIAEIIGVSNTEYSNGFTVVTNMETPGVLIISMASARPLIGSGDLVDITFDVVGVKGESTVLDITSASLNEDEISALFKDGSIMVDSVIFSDSFE